ncbi:protein arginine kinase [Serpentinicella sp. ANB-PHB4]|uniref:protein arginine kinase n=1 Tax=Serpentinicella sp. ANB-PHB4 TaxID=3074076 RepID=UPI00285CBB3B|nr:protein arginine kinase [Serpentinicella sp. ANB-PHB4]MDR5659910.1 protein arginine kinase [Serpentinicella sp. ANB-PHB4]
MAKWIKEAGPQSDIVLSTRVRLARNFEGKSFPHQLNSEEAKEITDTVFNTVRLGNESFEKDFKLIGMDGIDELEQLNLLERHLVSPDLIKNTGIASVLLNTEETLSILINEEDHIRIQCLLPGFQLQEAWDTANNLDDLLEENIKYAFEEQLGYLTACPTNLGTGIRVSVMLHLPALTLTGHIQGVLKAAGQVGLAIRGIYGEGTDFLGHLYQLSNQVTLGATEQEIISNIKDVTTQVIQNERSLREQLMMTRKLELEDKIYRSYGILKNARIMTRKEAMTLISDVKLGMALGLVEDISIEKLNELIALIQPGCLQKHFGKELTDSERDFKRSQLIREML